MCLQVRSGQEASVPVCEERSGGLFNCVSVCGEERMPAGLLVRKGQGACWQMCEERSPTGLCVRSRRKACWPVCQE